MPDRQVRQELGGGASLETLRALLGVPRPVGVRALLDDYAQPVVLSQPLNTAAGVALGGDQQVTLRKDGTYTFAGHFRATGEPTYRAALSTRVVGTDGSVFTLAAHGTVYGSDEAGDRAFPWNQPGSTPLIVSAWPGLRHAQLDRDFEHDGNVLGTAGDVLAFLGKAALLASTGGALGMVVAIGTEAAAALNLQEISLPGTVGVIVAGGVLLIGGPAALVVAIVAGAAAGAVVQDLVHPRPLTDPEFAFVDRVFHGTLPRQRILLTNLISVHGRAFTIPGPGDTIFVNIGKGFDDPTSYTGHGDEKLGIRAPGQLLVHELTHAWQMAHTSFLPGLLCNAASLQVGTLGGDMSVYQYGPPGPAWGSFNLEQQASIVEQWFAGSNAPAVSGSQQRQYAPLLDNDSDPTKPENPYWRYIRDNIRAGVG